jgi:hypothetical protein
MESWLFLKKRKHSPKKLNIFKDYVYDFYSKKYHSTFCNSCGSTSTFIRHVQLKPILGTVVAE